MINLLSNVGLLKEFLFIVIRAINVPSLGIVVVIQLQVCKYFHEKVAQALASSVDYRRMDISILRIDFVNI